MKKIYFLFYPPLKITLFLLLTFTIFINNSDLLAKFRDIDYAKCQISSNSYDLIIEQVKKGNYNALTSPKDCIKRNQKLVFESCLIDPKQLQFALNIFRNNENFVYRLIKVHPEALQYASKNLRSDPDFIEKTLFINRDSLKFASPKLTDNFSFMKRMIIKDSRNYMFASNRIQKMPQIAKLAFKDNGGLLLYAPQEVKDDKKLVIEALKSSSDAFEFLSKEMREDPQITKIASYKKHIYSKKKLENHILTNYILKPDEDHEDENQGLKIDSSFTNFPQNKLIDRNYVIKWHKSYKLQGLYLKEKWKIISFDSRNHVPNWKAEMKDYPILVEKINRFFKARYIDQNTIDGLRLTYLWKVQDDPSTIAFNLYLLRDSKDAALAENFVNIISLTAISRQTKDKKDWRLSVVDVIFDKEIRSDIAYQFAHKKYFLQDLYVENKKDKTPKIIFRVEDRFDSYFEIFNKMSADKYQLTYRINPDKIRTDIDYDTIDEFGLKRNRQEQEEYEWQKLMEECREDNSGCKKKSSSK